ncbi:multidrug transporter [Amycolatopsis orientalis]|uniref:Multidrug transporter n=1 Tax=Amycolatopsis orientalis TaxID=31958 RepID=A0A193CBD1_AMYOR|nr:DHA2 family efflux MFS transporter permease subunit [Amycolatopsis orientalis]ANN21673.1 multidrug transporter [Amycolatopsis orientalis]
MTDSEGKPWGALAALCSGVFLFMLDTAIVPVTVPVMVRELSASLNSVVWVTSVYLFASAVPMLFTSKLGTRYGPKRVFVAGLALFTAASVVCGAATSISTLIVARGLQGFGAALMTPQTLTLLTHLFPPSSRGVAMGVWGAVSGLATVTGPLVGGTLVDSLGWPWIFYINVPIGGLALILAVMLIPDWRPRDTGRFDVPGIVLSGAGFLLFVFGVHNGQRFGWGEVWGGVTVSQVIVTGLILLVAFAWWQRVARFPLMPLRMFANRDFSVGVVTLLLFSFAVTGMFFPLMIYFQTVLGLSPSTAGMLTAPMSLLSGTVAPLGGWLAGRFDAKILLVAGLTLVAGGLTVIATMVAAGTGPWSLLPGLLLCGTGMGIVFSPMSTLTMGSVRPEFLGPASGTFNMAFQAGGVLGSATVGVLLQARIAAVHETDLATAVKESLWLPVGVLLAGALVATGLRSARQRIVSP